MFKLQILCIFTFLYTLHCDSILGKGLWSLFSITECPERLSKEIFKFNINKHKLNRTQEGITAHVIVSEKITQSHGIIMKACKFLDGGCKPYSVVADNVGHMIENYGKDLALKILKEAKNKHEYFPIEKGEYVLEDFVFDYCGLRHTCLYGKYEFTVYLTSYLQKVACVKMVTECNKCEEEDCCGSE